MRKTILDSVAGFGRRAAAFGRRAAATAVDLFRTWPMLLIAMLVLTFVVANDIARLDVLIWGSAKLALFGYWGYWIDRWTFPYARPHESWWSQDPPDDTGLSEEAAPDPDFAQLSESLPVITADPQKRRAWIICACIIFAALLP